MTEDHDEDPEGNMSASERLSRKLSLGRARQLEQMSQGIVPRIFEGLVTEDRKILLEVSEASDSLLAATIQSASGSTTAASHCAMQGHGNLGTSEGLSLVMDLIRLEKPRHVWLCPPSDAFSPLQSMNQKDPEQQRLLREKRKQATKVYLGAIAVLHLCRQLGVHCTWQWPEHCNGWRLPVVQRMLQKGELKVAVTKGCRVNFRVQEEGALIKNGWKIATTCSRLAEVLQMPCRCTPEYKHGVPKGSNLQKGPRHTPEYCKKVAQVMVQELNSAQIQDEMRGHSSLSEGFGEGMCCVCSEVCTSDSCVKCGLCNKASGTSELDVAKATGSRQGSRLEAGNQVEGESEVSVEELQAYMSAEQVAQAETVAKELLEAKNFKTGSCEELLRLLPLRPINRHRRMLGDLRTVYVTLGVYAYGNHYGLTHKGRQFPHLCRYLNAFLENWSGGPFCRSSITISLNNLLPMHRDVNNDPNYDNHSIGLGNFQHGGLWIQTPQASNLVTATGQRRQLPSGEWATGQVHDIKGRVVRFSPKLWHETQKWTGERIVVTGFVSRGVHQLNSQERQTAKQHGFNLPPKNVPCGAHVKEVHEAHAVSKGPEAKEEERIMKQLHLLHSATGHGSVATMLDALKRRGVSDKVMQVAQRFQCSACQERKKPPPRHLASLEILPPRWHTISADIGHWTHPRTGEHNQFMLVIDEGCRYRTAKILSKGSKQQPSAAVCLDYLREGWCQIFGRPDVLRLDPAGAFRSRQVEDYCDRNSIYLDLIPADAHWQLGVCEQAVKGIKHVLTHVTAVDDRLSSEEALSLAVEVFNSREQIRGFTPIQHAFGRNPDITGRMIARPEQLPDDLVVENATEEFHRVAKARAEAEKSLCDWQAQQRITRALNSRSRPLASYSPGDLVFFWRTQESGQGRRAPSSKHGRFLGPARILATEGRKNPDGTMRAGSAIWLVRGRSLMKCSPEQLRHASAREALLEALASRTPEGGTPWSFQKVAEEIGGNRYEDISGEIPEAQEWTRAQDPEQEVPPQRFVPPRTRVRGKRGSPEDATDMQDESEEEMPSTATSSRGPKSRKGRPPIADGLTAEAWWEQVPEAHFSDHSCFWAEESAAIEVAIDMPESKRGVEAATRDLSGFFVSALKRKAVEVSERRLNEGERQAFKEAKAVEVKNFVASRAFEALPSELRPDREQAMGMRWLLTWKLKEDGSYKAKARAILLGYQDPAYAQRSTTSPVMTRQTRQMLLQLALNHQWSVYKGDVSGAFLQGREYPETLFCIPCDEICHAMGLASGSIVRMRKACYGLVDAPLEWYRTIAEYFESQGLQRLWSDACAWVYRSEGKVKGIISGHVDDFLFSGDESDASWRRIIENIQSRFKWGDWDKDSFVQCGVQVTRKENQFLLSQPNYVEAIPEINVNSRRKKQSKEATTPHEKSQLRGLLGALSWHAQQVAPHVSADVSLMLSEVSQSCVELIDRANRLLQQVKARKSHTMVLHAFPVEEPLGLYAWVDAGNQNRHDGGSTQGILIGLAPTSMMQGALGKVSLMSWHSNKIDRACRSPGASESQAAISGEDLLYFARYEWSEICFGGLDVRDPDSCVRKVPGTLITDSRNVYDKLSTEVLTIKGAERKSNLELLSVKEAQQRTDLQVRWVHSEAQLANSLTKQNGGHELELYYKMGHSWRIVEDPSMRSARKRKAEGHSPLENLTGISNCEHSIESDEMREGLMIQDHNSF